MKWKKQEKQTAKDFNGRRTPGSGSKWGAKGDVKTPKFLIEDKSTDKKSYTLKHETWKKIYHEALTTPNLTHRIALMEITFEKDGTKLIVLDKHDFLDLFPDAKL